MAKRLTYNILTGNDQRVGICLYYSPYFGHNIMRKASRLTAARTKKDPAFKGFRQSSSRMKQASPIAASLYKLLPPAVKQFSLYRQLTGEAFKMLKQGMESLVITETLKKKYIDPLMDAPESNSISKAVEEPANKDAVSGMSDFTGYPAVPSALRRIRSRRRSRVLHSVGDSKETARSSLSAGRYPLPQTGKNPSGSADIPIEPPEERILKVKTTHGLIYLGRLPEYKKIKMWMRASVV